MSLQIAWRKIWRDTVVNVRRISIKEQWSYLVSKICTKYFKISFIHPTVPGEITGAVRCIADGRSPIQGHRLQVKSVQIAIVHAG